MYTYLISMRWRTALKFGSELPVSGSAAEWLKYTSGQIQDGE